MVHQRFDINRWTSLYSLKQLRDEAREFVNGRRDQFPDEYPNNSAVEDHVRLMSPSGEIISSPHDLAVVDQLRAEVLRDRGLLTMQTDVLIFGEGEPQDRGITKIGGLPFWPRQKAWPVSRSGVPMGFVAQFCFADSTDIVGELPGDVLLIFAAGIHGADWHDSESDALYFEWVRRTECIPIERPQVPKTKWNLMPLYGELYRTVDYAGVEDVLDGGDESLQRIAIIEGTKIGGIPHWLQDGEDLPGRFLCALASVNPDPYLSYPFINVPEPLGPYSLDGKSQSGHFLMWGDVGSLFIFLDEQASIHWAIQSY